MTHGKSSFCKKGEYEQLQHILNIYLCTYKKKSQFPNILVFLVLSSYNDNSKYVPGLIFFSRIARKLILIIVIF